MSFHSTFATENDTKLLPNVTFSTTVSTYLDNIRNQPDIELRKVLFQQLYDFLAQHRLNWTNQPALCRIIISKATDGEACKHPTLFRHVTRRLGLRMCQATLRRWPYHGCARPTPDKSKFCPVHRRVFRQRYVLLVRLLRVRDVARHVLSFLV